ncbi:hypothetical protein ANO14919_031210 [Xylariales sp. No.14919]|nr:hypothetical protein ANO14919_031210 [Xylariales sp. No.14919]
MPMSVVQKARPNAAFRRCQIRGLVRGKRLEERAKA